jgi:hypothetical protein
MGAVRGEQPLLVRIDTTQIGKSASRRAVMVLAAMISQTCESCGREFGCGAQDETCWCARVELGPERRAILREHFERCLCPDCLEVAAREARPLT